MQNATQVDHVRCPSCDYIVSALPTDRCPECGATFDLHALRQQPRFRPPVLLLAGLATTLLVPAWLTITTCPSTMSPGALLVMVPFLLTESLLAIAAPPLLFLLCALILTAQRRWIRWLSIGFCAAVLLISVLHFVGAWKYGLRWQGGQHVMMMLALNVGFAAGSIALCARAASSRTYGSGLAFLYGTWCWLAWAALPWLGELP